MTLELGKIRIILDWTGLMVDGLLSKYKGFDLSVCKYVEFNYKLVICDLELEITWPDKDGDHTPSFLFQVILFNYCVQFHWYDVRHAEEKI